ncbi:hypothetical protein Dimus_024697, partial [Dionaea muscipula]
MVDGEFREKIGCRRSVRLSSPAIPTTDELGFGRSTDVKLIEAGLKPLDADLRPIEGAPDLGSLLPAITEETNLATGESLEALNSSCCEDGDSVTRPMISRLSQTPLHDGAISPSLMPLTRSAESLRCGSPSLLPSTIGEEEMGDGIGGSGSMADGLTSVQAMSLPTDFAVELAVESLVVSCEEDGEMLPRMPGGVLAGEPPLDSEEAGASMVDGAMEGGQLFRVDAGVALRLPSTDGRQQRLPQSADRSCSVVGEGHDGRGGSVVSQGEGGVQVFHCGDEHQ